MTTDPVLERVTTAFHAVLGRERVVMVTISSDRYAVAHLATGHRFGKVRLGDLVELAQRLDVTFDQIEIWDDEHDAIEVTVDLDEITPIERPVIACPMCGRPKPEPRAT